MSILLDSSVSPQRIVRLSACDDRNPADVTKGNVLLVEPAMVPRSERERLLNAANYCVTAVCDVRDMFLLRWEKPLVFAILNDSLGPYGLKAAAESARRYWPLAKVVVVGCAVPALEDHLYDEAISHKLDETGFLDLLEMMTKGFSAQMMTLGYAGYRRAASILKESDLTKFPAQSSTHPDSPHDVPAGIYRMRKVG